MNPVIFNLANLNLTVTIDAKARVTALEDAAKPAYLDAHDSNPPKTL